METSKFRFEGLVQLLRHSADRPLIDETGLSGNFEAAALDLGEFAQLKRNDPQAAQNMLSEAVQEKLGLKLQPTKRKTEVLVIKHVERPSQN
jgi:uncharacterized protein (TIGR03435 family)